MRARTSPVAGVRFSTTSPWAPADEPSLTSPSPSASSTRFVSVIMPRPYDKVVTLRRRSLQRRAHGSTRHHAHFDVGRRSVAQGSPTRVAHVARELLAFCVDEIDVQRFAP